MKRKIPWNLILHYQLLITLIFINSALYSIKQSISSLPMSHGYKDYGIENVMKNRSEHSIEII